MSGSCQRVILWIAKIFSGHLNNLKSVLSNNHVLLFFLLKL